MYKWVQSAMSAKYRNLLMKLIYIPVVMLALSSCQSMHSKDPSSLSFKIPEGSTLTLNKDLMIPDEKTHAMLQGGKVITVRERNDYQINCRFDVKKYGPRTIKPETFRITRTEDGADIVSQAGIIRFYSDIYLASDKGTDVIKFTCQQYGGKTDVTFAYADITKAPGNYFSFSFLEK